jgi:hypothetical protein
VSALTAPRAGIEGLDGEDAQRRVSYLFGAGATQGAVQYAGSAERLVMPGLIGQLLNQTSNAYAEDFSDHDGLKHLVNDVVDDTTDFEHLLTFLADTPSQRYQDFAERLNKVFSAVLRRALGKVRSEVGDQHSALYAALLDMHEIPGSGEQLVGLLTLNYDNFLEHAIEHALGRTIDYGVEVGGSMSANGKAPIPVLKLHGSFSWRSIWPIEVAEETDLSLWIPPGIRKAKSEYPFNAIWGRARELLDCDVLRILGCNLGPNDWDLISLLFTTMHGRESAQPYEIEMIGWPDGAEKLQRAFPYLNSRSLLEIPDLGVQLIAEVLGGEPKDFSDLNESDQNRAREAAATKISNPFDQWLRLKGELMLSDLGSIHTEHDLFQRFIEEPI